MAKAVIGAQVQYCGHPGWFIADIFEVGNVNVVRANKAVTGDVLYRGSDNIRTHHIVDFPVRGFWRPDLGVFVVPKTQVTLIKP